MVLRFGEPLAWGDSAQPGAPRFKCVFKAGTDSYYPSGITLSILKFVSIKSLISNICEWLQRLFTGTLNLYAQLVRIF